MSYELRHNQYGFVWGEVMVERTCSNDKKPKFQVIRIYAPNGEGVTITMTPRTLRFEKFDKPKKDGTQE
jgi:hypothetical protein